MTDDQDDRPKRIRYRTPQYTTEALRAVAAFLPIFGDPDFEFVTGIGASEPFADGFRMPVVHYHPQVLQLVWTVERYGWVYGDATFTWPRWKATEEAIQLRDDPDTLALATPEQLAKLMTIFVRQERFSDGAMHSFWEDGLLQGILRRADTLARELEGAHP